MSTQRSTWLIKSLLVIPLLTNEPTTGRPESARIFLQSCFKTRLCRTTHDRTSILTRATLKLSTPFILLHFDLNRPIPCSTMTLTELSLKLNFFILCRRWPVSGNGLSKPMLNGYALSPKVNGGTKRYSALVLLLT